MRFLSKTPKETRKLQIRPHLAESKGCLKQNKQLFTQFQIAEPLEA